MVWWLRSLVVIGLRLHSCLKPPNGIKLPEGQRGAEGQGVDDLLSQQSFHCRLKYLDITSWRGQFVVCFGFCGNAVLMLWRQLCKDFLWQLWYCLLWEGLATVDATRGTTADGALQYLMKSEVLLQDASRYNTHSNNANNFKMTWLCLVAQCNNNNSMFISTTLLCCSLFFRLIPCLTGRAFSSTLSNFHKDMHI